MRLTSRSDSPREEEFLRGASPEVVAFLRSVPIWPPTTLEREMRRQESGAVYEVPQPSLDQLITQTLPQDVYMPVLNENAAFLRGRFEEKAVAAALENPGLLAQTADIYPALVARIGAIAEQKRQRATRLAESLNKDKQLRKAREGNWETVRRQFSLIAFGHLVRQAQLEADTYEMAHTMLKEFEGRLDALHGEQAILAGTIDTARRLATPEVAEHPLPNDLLPEIEEALVEVFAQEPDDVALLHALHAVRSVMQQNGGQTTELTAEGLLEATRQQAPPAGWRVASLQEVIERLAPLIEERPEDLWRYILHTLGNDPFSRSPVVPHLRQPNQYVGTFTFQVTPVAQTTELTTQQGAARSAVFTTPGPTTRWGLVHLVTNLPLNGFLPAREAAVHPGGTDASNPYILPTFAARFGAPVSTASADGHVAGWDETELEEVHRS